MFKFLNLFLILCFTICFAEEYEFSVLNTDSFMFKDIDTVIKNNDKGCVVGSYCNNSLDKYEIYLYTPGKGVNIIESKDHSIRPVALNNAGQIIGKSSNGKSFIWSKSLGIRWIDIPDGSRVAVNGLNDLGQIIGTYNRQRNKFYEERPFLWDYGVVNDLGVGSEFSQAIEALGYHVMNIEIQSINNKGEMLGYFVYGKLNVKTGKYVSVGYKSFFWDGEIQILALPTNIHYFPEIMEVNNQSVVMVSINLTTYIWDYEGGVRTIENFKGKALNDLGTILGEAYQKDGNDFILVPSIYKDETTTNLKDLLGIEDFDHMASHYSDDYAIECLSCFSDINNKGQIVCMGSIWGDLYPCLLNKKKEYLISNSHFEDFMSCYRRDKNHDGESQSPLSFAIRYKYQDLLDELIRNSLEIDTHDQNLFIAAETGNTEAISLMSKSGWNLNCRKKTYGESLLHQAARFGHWDTCLELINHGLSCNDETVHHKYSPLYLTTELANTAQSNSERKNAFNTALILLANGADPNGSSGTDYIPLVNICGGKYDYKFIDLLITSGADPNLILSDGTSSLSNIIGRGTGNLEEKINAIHKLLESGSNPNHSCCIRNYGFLRELKDHNYSITPIVALICQNESVLVEILIQYGADIISPVRSTKFGTLYPLDYAVKWNRKEIIEILTRNGAKKSS